MGWFFFGRILHLEKGGNKNRSKFGFWEDFGRIDLAKSKTLKSLRNDFKDTKGLLRQLAGGSFFQFCLHWKRHSITERTEVHEGSSRTYLWLAPVHELHPIAVINGREKHSRKKDPPGRRLASDSCPKHKRNKEAMTWISEHRASFQLIIIHAHTICILDHDISNFNKVMHSLVNYGNIIWTLSMSPLVDNVSIYNDINKYYLLSHSQKLPPNNMHNKSQYKMRFIHYKHIYRNITVSSLFLLNLSRFQQHKPLLKRQNINNMLPLHRWPVAGWFHRVSRLPTSRLPGGGLGWPQGTETVGWPRSSWRFQPNPIEKYVSPSNWNIFPREIFEMVKIMHIEKTKPPPRDES